MNPFKSDADRLASLIEALERAIEDIGPRRSARMAQEALTGSTNEIKSRIEAILGRKLRPSNVIGAVALEEAAAKRKPEGAVVPFARPKARRIARPPEASSTTLRLAAASSEAPLVAEFSKYEGWDVAFGEWVCEFYSDGQYIHVAGLPENEVRELTLCGKRHPLAWVPKLKMHRVKSLSRRELSNAINTLADDDSVFDVR
jgi:hypothetical protein